MPHSHSQPFRPVWLLLALCALAGTATAGEPQPVFPAERWKTADPADLGLDGGKLNQARDYALTADGSGIIVYRGEAVLRWGDQKRRYDLKSSTKGIGITTLGLAIADGKIALDDKAREHHPTLGVPPESNAETGWLDEITILHLATQTAGFEKRGGYEKLLFKPGTKWHYSDGGPNWLAECVTLEYRRDLNDLMFERVCSPLGIGQEDLTWRKNAYRPHEIEGIPRREFGAGIHANVDAMARVGYLYLREGKWNGRQIIPRDFVRAASRPVKSVVGLPVFDPKNHGKASEHYGLLWWNNADGTLENVPRDAFWTWGLFDSITLVVPSLDLVVARAGPGGRQWKRDPKGDHYDVLRPFFEPIVAAAKQANAGRGKNASKSATLRSSAGNALCGVPGCETNPRNAGNPRNATEGVPYSTEAVRYSSADRGSSRQPEDGSLDRAGTQWSSVIEWSLKNPTSEGNPFDLQATVTFTHAGSDEKRTTGMFYAGGDAWKFRFTGTRPGRWTFTTESDDADLDGHEGTVTVKANPRGYGFVTHKGSKWARPTGEKGRLEAFVPQYVMFAGPHEFYGKPETIDRAVETFIVEHGFTGLHVPVTCRWFDLQHDRADEIDDDDPNPDPRTFEALEMLITKVHRAGGAVHLWAWGDQQRTMTPVKWGINGRADRRLQRYIAARLGPLPGWTMGYGFDLWEWTKEDDLRDWHAHVHGQFGWPHLLGARAHKNKLTQIYDGLDYSSYEQHRPDYEMYVRTIENRPAKPSFSEDRFRIRQSERYASKDYTMEMTRRGLWHSTMAGGVANIWGNLQGDLDVNYGRGASRPYPEPHAIKTWNEFFRGRFLLDMHRQNKITDGVCLKDGASRRYVFYKEDADSIHMDLSSTSAPQPAVAVDAKKEYKEIDVGRLEPKKHTWKPPYRSDWALAVGQFNGRQRRR